MATSFKKSEQRNSTLASIKVKLKTAMRGDHQQDNSSGEVLAEMSGSWTAQRHSN